MQTANRERPRLITEERWGESLPAGRSARVSSEHHGFACGAASALCRLPLPLALLPLRVCEQEDDRKREGDSEQRVVRERQVDAERSEYESGRRGENRYDSSGGPGDRAEPPGAQVMVEKGDRDMLYRGEPSTRNRVRAEVTCAAQQQEELRSAGGTEELQRVLRRVDAIRGPSAARSGAACATSPTCPPSSAPDRITPARTRRSCQGRPYVVANRPHVGRERPPLRPLVQSAISLTLAVMVVAWAVNILG